MSIKLDSKIIKDIKPIVDRVVKSATVSDTLAKRHKERYPAQGSNIIYPHITSDEALKAFLKALDNDKLFDDDYRLKAKTAKPVLQFFPEVALKLSAYLDIEEEFPGCQSLKGLLYSSEVAWGDKTSETIIRRFSDEYKDPILDYIPFAKNLNKVTANNYTIPNDTVFINKMALDSFDQLCAKAIAEVKENAKELIWHNYNRNANQKFLGGAFDSSMSNWSARLKQKEKEIDPLVEWKYEYTYYPIYVLEVPYGKHTFLSTVHAITGEVLLHGSKQGVGYMHEALKGNPSSVVRIGKYYKKGSNGLPLSYDKAIECFQYAINAKELSGYLNLGLMYYEGLGVKLDYQKSYELFEKAGSEGLFYCALHHLYGYGKYLNTEKALTLLKRSAASGDKDAEKLIEDIKANKVKTIKSSFPQDIIDLYTKVEQNDIDAILTLANRYLNPTENSKSSFQKDPAIAFSLYEKAASLNSTLAKYHLGKLYLEGLGVTKDESKALVLLKEAASKDCVEAIFALGLYYAKAPGDEMHYYTNEKGFGPNLAKAHQYFTQASKLNHPEANNQLQNLKTQDHILRMNKNDIKDFKIKNGILLKYKGKSASVVVPPNVVEVSSKAFRKNKKIKTVEVGNSVKKLAPKAFEKCINLKKITLRKNILLIPAECFSGCSNLENVVSSCEIIAEKAFYGCEKLNKAIILQTREIHTLAFYGCKSLNSLSLSNITKIDPDAFKGFTKKQTIYIPKDHSLKPNWNKSTDANIVYDDDIFF